MLLVEEALRWAGSHHTEMGQALLYLASAAEADSLRRGRTGSVVATSVEERRDSALATIVEEHRGWQTKHLPKEHRVFQIEAVQTASGKG